MAEWPAFDCRKCNALVKRDAWEVSNKCPKCGTPMTVVRVLADEEPKWTPQR